MAWSTCSGKGGALFGTSLVLQVLSRRHAPGKWPFSLASWSWSPATVSLAWARPWPWDHRYSRKSQTNGSNWCLCLGNAIWLSLRNCKKPSTALLYLAFVAGCTVSSRKLPKCCLCLARSDCVLASNTRLGIFELAPNPPAPSAWGICGILISMNIAPEGLRTSTQ